MAREIDHLVVISDQSAPIGGAEAMALLTARTMADARIKVTFIVGDSAARCPLDSTKVDVVALGASAPREGAYAQKSGSGLFNLAAYGLISDFIRQNDTPRTVYHLHNWSKILSPAVFLALKPVSSRLFISAHDFALVCPNLSYSNYQKHSQPCPLVPLSVACLLTNCDRRSYSHKIWRAARSFERRLLLNFGMSQPTVGVIHPDMLEYFTRGGIPRERLQVVRNPVTPFKPFRVKAELNHDLFFIGRVVHEKGVDLAAEAARLVGRRLRVIGDGDLRPDLARRYPDVVFEGWRTHDGISELIGDARALIVPSRLPETFTLVAHEAMRSGIPVVAFSDVDCSEAAQLGAAIVVPPREPSSLAAGLRQLDDDDTVERISKRAMLEAGRFSHTEKTWCEAMLDQYRALLTSPLQTAAI